MSPVNNQAAADNSSELENAHNDTESGHLLSRQQVQEQIAANAIFDAPYAIMNILATIIACYGLFENSAAVVIGAMLVAMLLGPISGIALALVTGDSKLLGRSFASEVAGVALVLSVSFVLGKIHHDLPIGSQILSRTSPNILDLIIALAGGVAGAYATLSPKIRPGLVGVAVATALVPPLAVCGICLARAELALAWGGFLLFFTNFVAIQFAFSVVLGLYGHYRTYPNERSSRRRAISRQLVSIVLLVVLAVVLGSNFAQSVDQQNQEAAIRAALAKGLSAYPGAKLSDLDFSQAGQDMSVTAVVFASGAVSPAKVAALQAELPVPKNMTLDLQVRSVITKTATASGYIQDSKENNAVPTSTPSATDTSPQVPNASQPPSAPNSAPDTSNAAPQSP